MKVRPGWIGIATGLALGAALQTLAQGQKAPAPTQKMYVAPQVETPNFYNMTLQQVNQANLTTVGAKQGTVPIFNRVTPLGPLNGLVILQIPAAGTKVSPGQQGLMVTMGPAPTKQVATTSVPPLTGMSVANATQALQKASLQLGQVSGQTKSLVALSIVSQTPAAGSRVAVGTVVDVTLEQQARMYVPDVTGLTVDAATAKLQTFQLRLGQVTSQTANWTGLKIVSESPQAGTAVALGTAVGVTLEAPLQPPPQQRVLVPTLIGSTVAQARTTLSGLGLELGPVKGEVKGQVPQTIVGQAPSAGTSVVAGTAVTVTLEPPPQAKVPEVPNPQPLTSTGDDNSHLTSFGWIVAGGGVLLVGAVSLGLLLARLIWPPVPPTPPVPDPVPPPTPAVPPPIATLKPEANMAQSRMNVSAQPAIRLLVQLRGRPARAQYKVGRSTAIVTRKDSRG